MLLVSEHPVVLVSVLQPSRDTCSFKYPAVPVFQCSCASSSTWTTSRCGRRATCATAGVRSLTVSCRRRAGRSSSAAGGRSSVHTTASTAGRPSTTNCEPSSRSVPHPQQAPLIAGFVRGLKTLNMLEFYFRNSRS